MKVAAVCVEEGRLIRHRWYCTISDILLSNDIICGSTDYVVEGPLCKFQMYITTNSMEHTLLEQLAVAQVVKFRAFHET